VRVQLRDAKPLTLAEVRTMGTALIASADTIAQGRAAAKLAR
jgi:hypothetical protein